jgi:hypothetical protein
LEGFRVLHKQHLATILRRLPIATETGDRRLNPSRNSGLVFKRDPNVE